MLQDGWFSSPRARFSVSTTQHVPSAWTIEGFDPFTEGMPDASRADLMLVRSPGPVFEVVGAHHVAMRGLRIDCAEIPGSVGIYYDAINATHPGSPASGQSVFEHLAVEGCEKGFEWGNDRFAAAGSSVRASQPNDWGDDSQADTTYVHWVRIRSTLPGSMGFFINGANKANLSAIEHAVVEGVTYGFYLASVPPHLRIDDVVGSRIGFESGANRCLPVTRLPADGHFGRSSPRCGGLPLMNHAAPEAALFYVAPTDLLIRNSRSAGGCARFLLIDHDPCGAFIGAAIVLEHNTFAEPVEAGSTAARILSIGNTGPIQALADGPSMFVTSVHDAPGLWHGSGHIVVVPKEQAEAIEGAMAPFEVPSTAWSDVASTYPLGAAEAAVSDRADLHDGNDAGDKIAAAIEALPAPGGTVDATGLTGSQEIHRNVFAGAAGKKGRLVLSPALVASVFATQHLPSNWSIEGHPGGLGTGGDSAFGTTLVAAAGATPVIEAEQATNIRIHGLQVLCSAPDSTGVHIDTERPIDRAPPGSGLSVLEMLSVYGCSTGIDWGPRMPAPQELSIDTERLWMRSVHVRSRNGTSTGLRISGSGSKATPLSVLDGVLVQEVTYGVDVRGTQRLAFRELCGGAIGISPSSSSSYQCRIPPADLLNAAGKDGTPPPSVLLVDASARTRVALINSQSEGGCALHVNLQHRGSDRVIQPVVLLKNGFDEPVAARAEGSGQMSVLSLGNRGLSSAVAEGQGLLVTAVEEARSDPSLAGSAGDARLWICRSGAKGTRFAAADASSTHSVCSPASP